MRPNPFIRPILIFSTFLLSAAGLLLLSSNAVAQSTRLAATPPMGWNYPYPITVQFQRLGLHNPSRARDLWRHKDLGTLQNSYTATVPAHGVVMLRLTP